jgi:hypothetical protein
MVHVAEEEITIAMQEVAECPDLSAVSLATNLPPKLDPEDANADRGAAWRSHAAELAQWVLPLVLRSDCHGGHILRSDMGSQIVERTTLKSPLTQQLLERHFTARDARDVRGLHMTSADEFCLLVVVDIDAHGDADDDPVKNEAFARHVHAEARRLGLASLLFDSNGGGGYHVWVLLGRRTPMAQAWRQGKYLVRDHEVFGLARPPETFPKSPYLTGKRFGGWVRIFGRHHKRAFWTRVWDESRGRWVEGEQAVEVVLGTTAVPVEIATVLPEDFTGSPPRVEPADEVTARRSRDYGHRRKVRLAGEALGSLRGGEVDDYNVWLRVGMCLSELGDDGLRLWDTWSQQSTKYRPGETREKWLTFQPGDPGDPRAVGQGTLLRMAEAYGFKGHQAARRWAEYQELGPAVLGEGEDTERLADEAREQKFSLACDEAIAALEARPDFRAELAASWGVSEQVTRLIGAGLREDMALWLDQYMPTGRWAVTVPLSSAGGLTVGFVRLYPDQGWKARPAFGGRPGLILPWDLEARDGPLVVCAGPADTARALEPGGAAVGLDGPGSPLDELVSWLPTDRDVVVVPGPGRWADETAYGLGRSAGRVAKVLTLPHGARSLRDCTIERASRARQEHEVADE